ncbi:MAG: hypothetical protein KM312_10260 [Hydrogenibacillus schlegelii]|uniref:DNA primase DnaB-helicase binding domain-containing protein n=1 Tax=Hydrogenibacillus schlegelii TaxID=1484 RepID=A0A947CXM4_HYDSH|nr:hypothetical protein [Hydrogenibacillus schlegelii]
MPMSATVRPGGTNAATARRRAAFRLRVLQGAESYGAFRLERLKRGLDLGDAADRARYLEQAARAIAELSNPFEREAHIEAIVKAYAVPKDLFQASVRRLKRDPGEERQSGQPPVIPLPPAPGRPKPQEKSAGHENRRGPRPALPRRRDRRADAGKQKQGKQKGAHVAGGAGVPAEGVGQRRRQSGQAEQHRRRTKGFPHEPRRPSGPGQPLGTARRRPRPRPLWLRPE